MSFRTAGGDRGAGKARVTDAEKSGDASFASEGACEVLCSPTPPCPCGKKLETRDSYECFSISECAQGCGDGTCSGSETVDNCGRDCSLTASGEPPGEMGAAGSEGTGTQRGSQQGANAGRGSAGASGLGEAGSSDARGGAGNATPKAGSGSDEPDPGLDATSTDLVLGRTIALSPHVDDPSHACARKGDGRVACWGPNSNGELGDGTTLESHTPVLVTDLNDVVEIAALYQSTCARKRDGRVMCWGRNDVGQLGDGTLTRSTKPVQVLGLADAVELSAGREHVCARTRNDTVVCWGSNAHGQLGDSSTTSSSVPMPVPALADVAGIASGSSFSCARKRTGDVVCWGQEFGGKSPAMPGHRSAPAGVTDAKLIAAGSVYFCLIRATDAVICFADGDDDTSAGEPFAPKLVSLPDAAADLTVARNRICARTRDGSGFCWGRGLLGDGRSEASLEPRKVYREPGSAAFLELVAGSSQTCGRRTDDTIVCWGGNSRGELGNGTTEVSLVPAPVSAL